MGDKLRIMHIISALPYGGAEIVLANLAREQKRMNCDVRICCIREKGALAARVEQEGIPVDLIQFHSRWNPIDLARLARLLRKHHIQVVHTHMYRPNVSGTAAAFLARTPAILSNIQNVEEWDTRRQKFQDTLVARLKDKITAVSEAVSAWYHCQTGISREKIEVIHNAIAPEEFYKPESRSRIRSEFGISDEHVCVGVLARLVPQKDHVTMIHAAALVVKENSHVLFLFVGGGPLRTELEQLARQNGLEKNIIFTGLRSDIPDILAALDISALSSLKEGFSLSILESMAAGLPVVATAVGGNAEAVVHDQTGFIVGPRNVTDLAVKILLLSNNPDLRHTLGAAGARRVREHYTVTIMAEKLIKLYRSILESKRPGNR